MLIKLPRLQQIALKNPNPKESPVHSDFCSVKALGNKIYSPPVWPYLQESTFCPRCVKLLDSKLRVTSPLLIRTGYIQVFIFNSIEEK